MKIGDLLHIAFMNLWRRKLRAFLTVLGMVIGTTSIVVMVSLGIGMQESTRQMFESWGSLSVITVNSWSYEEMGNGQGRSKEVTLNDKSIEAFRRLSGVKSVMPQVQTSAVVTSGQYASDLQLIAVDPALADEFGFQLAEGEMPEHVGGSRVEIVFGAYVLESFINPKTQKSSLDAKTGENRISMEKSRFQLTFDWNNVYNNSAVIPEGETPAQRGKFYKLEPVGVQAIEGNNNHYYSLINIETLRRLAKENKNYAAINFDKYETVLVKCANTSEVTTIQKAIQDMGYGAYSLQDSLEMQQQSAKQTQALLGGIGGVALFVAAIGIMNTMMMSIYERTREIGIIKVLGCKMSNIAAMFLAESAYIGLFGGAIGLGLSYTLSFLLNLVMGGDAEMGAILSSVIPLWLAAGGVLFSIIVAVLSGLYPAIKAMRLSALAAIRAE